MLSFSSEPLFEISQIVIVDNDSKDGTRNVIRSIQSSHLEISKKIVFIENKKNVGLGGSQKIAYDYFLSNHFTHFMIIHGDNQCDGDVVAKSFLTALKKHANADAIYASRFTQDSNIQGYSILRTWGNYFFNFLTYLCTGQKMSDSGAGIICYRTAILRDIPYHELSNTFHFNPQLNILLHEKKALNIITIPLKWAESEEKSNVNSLRYCLQLLKILIRFRISRSFFHR